MKYCIYPRNGLSRKCNWQTVIGSWVLSKFVYRWKWKCFNFARRRSRKTNFKNVTRRLAIIRDGIPNQVHLAWSVTCFRLVFPISKSMKVIIPCPACQDLQPFRSLLGLFLDKNSINKSNEGKCENLVKIGKKLETKQMSFRVYFL